MAFSNNGFDTFLFYIFFEHPFTLIFDVFHQLICFQNFAFKICFTTLSPPPSFGFTLFNLSKYIQFILLLTHSTVNMLLLICQNPNILQHTPIY